MVLSPRSCCEHDVSTSILVLILVLVLESTILTRDHKILMVRGKQNVLEEKERLYSWSRSSRDFH